MWYHTTCLVILLKIYQFPFPIVILPNGLEIWWDGYARLYIDAKGSLKDSGLLQRGLCGSFNGKQDDDFNTPLGDVENEAAAFAHR